MQDDGLDAFFVGTYRHRIDAKGRISIPARWRSAFRSEEVPHVYVAPMVEQGAYAAIECVTQSNLRQRISEQADRTHLSQKRRGLLGVHHFHAYSAQPIDPAGRVQLPTDVLVAAKLTRSGNRESVRNGDGGRAPSLMAELIGGGDRFFILHPTQVPGLRAAAEAEAERADNRAEPGP